MDPIKRVIKRCLQAFGFTVIRQSELEKLRGELEQQRSIALGPRDIAVLSALPHEQTAMLLPYLQESKAQFRQDLFVLSELDFKKGGYFVEFGATNGIDLSNTYLLEKTFEWQGILAEPARGWHRDLHRNRQAHIEELCVWKDSTSTLTFNETPFPELSTLDSYSGSDFQRDYRTGGKTYDVRTISLLDLLRKFDAPKEIDYLSIDTEGSEFDILHAFDFDAYSIKIISCEHNFTPARERIFELLTRHGFVRKLQEVSVVDDWYVRAR
jgi:FkbM family methyltransferase